MLLTCTLRYFSGEEGRVYDNPDLAFVIPRIEAFIQAYDLKLEELLKPDIKKYKVCPVV